MKKPLLIILAAAISLLSCSEEKTMVYDRSMPSLNFAKSNYGGAKFDSLEFLALYSGAAEKAEMNLPLIMSGEIAAGDRTYDLRIDPGETRGIESGRHYDLPRRQTFRAGEYTDTMVITFNVKELREDEVKGRMRIELVPNGDFTEGLAYNSYMVINVSGAGLTERPLLWSNNKLHIYGGSYSHVKAEKFIELNGITSAEWRAENEAVLFAYAKKTCEWFEDNPTFEDGERVIFKGTVEF